MKSPRQLSDNPATVERRERKFYAELKRLEREWNKEVAAFMAKGMSFDEAWVATAALLAAAWDMREALELMLSHGERCNWFADRGDNEVCEQARAALAKANGETSI